MTQNLVENALTDNDLVARVRAGERQLFELIMRRNNQRVFRAARSIVRTDDEAEDVMQAAYVNAYAHLDDFAGRSQFSTWLVRIAVHEAFARVRQHRRVERTPDIEAETLTVEHASDDPERTAVDRQLLAVVENAIDALPEGFRTVLVLRTIENMSVAETADILEITEETVKTRLHRARALLHERVARHADSLALQAYGFHLSRCDRVVSATMKRIGAL